MMLAPLELTDMDDDVPDAVMRVWDACVPASAGHPYLARHGLPPGDLRVWKGGLIGPLRNSADRIGGLLIVDAAGHARSWLPNARPAHFSIGAPGDTVIIAVSDLADALALHDISGQQVYLANALEDALALRARLVNVTKGRRVLIAGLTIAEASTLVAPGAWSEEFVLLPMARSWSALRQQLGAAARDWIDDPILVFSGVTPARSTWLRRTGLWSRDAEGELVKLCGPVMATAMVRTSEGEGWSRLIWLINRDGVRQSLRLAESELLMGQRRVVSKLVDAGLEVHTTVATAAIVDHLRMAQITNRLRLVERGGWHCGHYLAPSGTIGPIEGDVPMRAGRMEMAPACNADELAQWQNDVAALAEGNSRLVLALCAAFAGLAIGLLPGTGSFGLHLRGFSSTGKSTALAVAASIFGPAMREILTWRATENGVEVMAEAHNHRLLILDEIAQIDPRAAAQVGYTLGNGMGKQRASGSGRSRQPALWQLVFLSSGEISLEEKIDEWSGAPSMREGQVVRVMDLPADAGAGFGLFDRLNGFSDGAALSDHFKAITSRSTGQVAMGYLEGLARDVVGGRQSLKDSQARFLAEYAVDLSDGLSRRAMGNFALLAAAGEMAIALGIVHWAEGHAMKQVARCARDWIAARGQDRSPDSLRQVREWLDRNSDNFAAWETSADVGDTEFGFVRKEPLTYFLRPAAWKFLCGIGDGVSAALHDAGLVQHKPVRLPGGKLVRFRVIDDRIMSQHWGDV